jgi:hypothetical protein
MVDAMGGRELFEVYTADQARLVLGTSHARSVSEAAKRRETNGGSPVHWDNKDPANPTAVQLFDATWVRNRALDHDGVHAELAPLLVPLPRRAGMTMSACRVQVERVETTAGVNHEIARRLEESEQVLDGYRREAHSERTARLESELAARDAEIARLKEELTRSSTAIGQLTKVIDGLNRVSL